MSRHAGKPLTPAGERRKVWQDKYGLTDKVTKKLYGPFLDQLDRCLSEEAQRLILGVSR